ncbi:MAG: hypothetical protein AAFU69_08130, partial [Pseudomonadota bacterium]
MSALGVWSVFFAAYLAFVGFAEEPFWLNWSALIYFPPWFLACLAAEAKSSRETYQPYESWLRRPYRTLVDGVLAGLPKLLTPATADDPPKHDGQSRYEHFWASIEYWSDLRARSSTEVVAMQADPWSWPVFDAALKIAVAYPLFLALSAWAMGGAAMLADLTLIPDEGPRWLRYGTFALLSATAFSTVFYSISPQSWIARLTPWLWWTAIAGAIISGFGITILGEAKFGPISLTVGALTIALGYLGANSIAFATSLALLYSASAKLAEALDLHHLLATALAAVLALLASNLVIVRLSRAIHAGHASVAFVGFWLFTTGAAIFGVVFWPETNTGYVFIIGLALLPLINAPFDYFSYGLTISLLKSGKNKLPRHLVNGMADVAAAGVLFFLLSCSLMAVFTGLSYARADEIFDVSEILLQVRDSPGEAGWIIAMVASTLLPTAIHLLIVVVSLSTLFSPRAYRALLAAMDDDSKGPPVVPTIGMAHGLG